MRKRAKKKRAAPVPRMGPATNLRPGGAHDDKRRPPRGEAERAALREAEAALDVVRTPKPEEV